MVKVAPVLRTAGLVGLTHTVWLSGQHSESIDDLIADFGVRSDFVRPQKSSERATIAGLLVWLPGAAVDCYRYVRRVAARDADRPLVIVHGDTLSTLVSAIAGKLAGGDIVHLESGLTSGRLLDPFPEEILRRLTFRLTRYAVCPNDSASRKMRDYRCEEIVDTGENTVLDCVRYALSHVDNHDLGAEPSYFVASIHRAQNIYLKSRLAGIVEEILSVSAFGEVHFVVHPATRKRLVSAGLWAALNSSPSIRLEPRMPYTEFLLLLAGARGVFSDGGSNQEELSYLGVPTVLFRDCTERSEGLGRNIILRDSIDQLTDFVRSGQIDLLRQPRRLQPDVKPSEIAIDALYRWSIRT